jgi:pimeloyl-ACP methyl ester carboxylesterase
MSTARTDPIAAQLAHSVQALVERYDSSAFEPEGGRARVRLALPGADAWDVVLEHGTARTEPPRGAADALMNADARTWASIVADPHGAMRAYGSGALSVRHNLHVGVGFLASTTGISRPGRLRFATVVTRRVHLSTIDAGTGVPVLAIHGLGATKGSFLPTVVALADRFRVIATDLPGFGDSDKPIGVRYDPGYFADTIIDLLDALGLERVHLIGNSLGGRIALEVAMRTPERVGRVALLAPSLAWRRPRRWAPALRLVRPELGLVQFTPRPVVQALVQRLVPGADGGWVAAGVDEFLRAYLTPAGRAAFYAAARHIYLEAPYGKGGFWPRLSELGPDALFVWGRRDTLVPIGFARHVAAALPQARQVTLDCGHVPQIERPEQTNKAIGEFLRGAARSPASLRARAPRPVRSTPVAGSR